MANVTITQLPAAGAITGTESVPIVQNGVTVRTTTGAIAASPSQPYTYLTVDPTPQLANSRYFGATNGLTLSDGGAQGVFNVTTTGALLSLVNSGTGFQVKTSSTALTSRSIAVSGAGLSIANGGGVSGNPTVSLNGQVLNFANASFNGLVVLSTAGAVTSAAITGTASQIDVTNGTGVSGNPTVALVNSPTVSGTMTAGSFSGAGTGLTGTAAALSIGGNAATATTAVTVPVRTTVLAESYTIVVDVATTDLAVQTNTLATGTLSIATSSGSPLNGQKFILRLRCTNPQTLSWGGVFAGSTDLILPTATTGSSKYDYVGFIYNSTAMQWQLLAKVFGF